MTGTPSSRDTRVTQAACGTPSRVPGWTMGAVRQAAAHTTIDTKTTVRWVRADSLSASRLAAFRPEDTAPERTLATRTLENPRLDAFSQASEAPK